MTPREKAYVLGRWVGTTETQSRGSVHGVIEGDDVRFIPRGRVFIGQTRRGDDIGARTLRRLRLKLFILSFF
jgi:hypothetical protein